MATITLSPIPVFTASVGVPRLAGIEYPLGLTLGMPGDTAGQRAVLRETLQALVDIDRPGDMVHLPFAWPEDLADVKTEPDVPPPIVGALIRRPWQFRRLLAGDIPE